MVFTQIINGRVQRTSHRQAAARLQLGCRLISVQSKLLFSATVSGSTDNKIQARMVTETIVFSTSLGRSEACGFAVAEMGPESIVFTYSFARNQWYSIH